MNIRKLLNNGHRNDNLRVLKQTRRSTTPKTGLFLCLKNSICVQCRVAAKPRKPRLALGTLDAFFILEDTP